MHLEPAEHDFICASMAPVIRQHSGIAFHSSRQVEASRSCSTTSASCIRPTEARSARPTASTPSQITGLRLCGMVEEPTFP